MSFRMDGIRDGDESFLAFQSIIEKYPEIERGAFNLIAGFQREFLKVPKEEWDAMFGGFFSSVFMVGYDTARMLEGGTNNGNK